MKYIVSTLVVLLFVGCGSTYDECKELNYKGIVIYSDVTNPKLSCSNGDKAENGSSYLTRDGTKRISWNAIFIPFTSINQIKDE